jgi:hypothetical protein
MPETTGPRHRRVCSLGRTLAAAVLLNQTGLDPSTIVAVIDGAAHLADVDNTDGAQLLLALATGDAAPPPR